MDSGFTLIIANFRKRRRGVYRSRRRMSMAAQTIGALLAVLALSLRAQPALFYDHEHGLSFSPDGTALLAPSGLGLAEYRDGVWSEVPGSIQSFSAFTVTESSIYASGHSLPGARPRTPVGLLKSTDGGQSWQSLALAGEADFALLAAGYRSNAVYVVATRPNPAMAAPGLFMTRDEGKTWRRAAARGLEGAIEALSAHPREAGTVAIATERGLYLSRDAGDSFVLLDREPSTGVAFDPEGRRLRYTRALSNQVILLALESRERTTLRVPRLRHDYLTCIAQNPKDERIFAFATRKRDVYVTTDGGLSWRRTATGEELQDLQDPQEDSEQDVRRLND